MNILFLSSNENFLNKNFYRDLFSECSEMGHEIYIVYSAESETDAFKDVPFYVTCLPPGEAVGGIKGLFSQSGPEKAYLNALRLNYSNVKFDLIFYNMDALGLEKVIHQIKLLNNAAAYLLADGAFLQAQVDISGLKKSTPEYKQLRKKEQALFEESDKICVFSENMKNYISDRNAQIEEDKFCIVPFGIKLHPMPDIKNDFERLRLRLRYAMPINKKAVVICGELSEYCGYETMIKFLDSHKNNDDILLIVYAYGMGYEKINEHFKDSTQKNLKIKKASPGEDLTEMLCACEAGVVFGDSRLSMPCEFESIYNFISCSTPVIACINSASALPESDGLSIRAEAGDIFDLNKKLAEVLEKGEKAESKQAENIDIKKTAQIILSN